MYKILRNFLFLFDAEEVHYFSMNLLKLVCSLPLGRRIIQNSFRPKDHKLQQLLFGITFANPVCMAAGFDKNAKYLNELQALGFGAVEIGTVTPKPQAGNDRQRLFRLPADKAIINRMGFNNDGVKVVAQRLTEWKESRSRKKSRIRLVIGGNIGKNKVTPNDEAWKDYEICFRELFDCVDYFVVNVSSPNTPGLRELQEKDSLRKILSHLQTINTLQATPKPILLKIAPDLTTDQLDDVIALCLEIQLDGLVATNTTIERNLINTPQAAVEKIGAGGMSGQPLEKRATSVVEYIHRKSGGAFPIIASGGIFTAADARRKLTAGASLIQVWTGFIYEGPSIVKNICKDL